MSAAISTTARLTTADDLLSRANLILRIEVSGYIEAHGKLSRKGEDYVPVPGSFDPGFADEMSNWLDLIRDIEAHLGGEAWEGPVGWLDDILARRNGWENGL